LNAATQSAIARLEQFMATVEDALALPREAAQFVHALVAATEASRAVEIGTSYGYSALWIASALRPPDARLVTIDWDPRKAAAARQNVAAAGLAEVVECRVGQAFDVLASIEGPVDFVLNDADKESCIAYVELLLPKLARKAVIMTDNTATHAPQLASFLDWVRGKDGFISVSVPVGNGMEMSVWRR
jgi:predicted O-methyltransferase YrrM